MGVASESWSDEELMRRAQHGEPQRFGELIRRYRPALLRVAESRLGSRAAAEDAVQEALLAAFAGRNSYQPAFQFRTWLWTILLNQCRTAWSKQQRREEIVTAHAQQQEQVSATGAARLAQQQATAPDARLLAQERREQLDRLLSELSDDQADALRLRFYAGLKFTEIAETVQCSLATAKNRVRWGLERLAERLDPSVDRGLAAGELP